MEIRQEIGRPQDLAHRSFPTSPGPLYQNEVEFSAFDMKMIFHSHGNKTHSHKKACALGFIFQMRVFRTRQWPVRAHHLHG